VTKAGPDAGSQVEEPPPCPKCSSVYTYEVEGLFTCPECSHEWTKASMEQEMEDDKTWRDSNGNVLSDGDNVAIIKDLKVKGSTSSIKSGTKVKNIRLLRDEVDGHDIDARIKGFGSVLLKSSIVKKV